MPTSGSPNVVRAKLITLLQNAYSGELAAFYAYDGHALSVRSETERAELRRIQNEEWEHRECVGRLLAELGAEPRPSRERLMAFIGRSISWFCRVGGWFVPMYGAGRLERGNIVEYEVAARLALDCGLTQFLEPLLKMAEIEWDHEAYFRRKVLSHPLRFVFPVWSLPPPRESIRGNFQLPTSERGA